MRGWPKGKPRGASPILGRPRKPDAEYKGSYRTVRGIRAHRLLVEQRTGIKLPATAVIHHYDPADKLTNKGTLVVCQDNSYHQLIEMRTRALQATGNPDWRKCEKCKQWDAPENLRIYARSYKRRPTTTEMRYLHRRKNNWCVDANGTPVAEVTPEARCSPEYAALLRERRSLRPNHLNRNDL